MSYITSECLEGNKKIEAKTKCYLSISTSSVYKTHSNLEAKVSKYILLFTVITFVSSNLIQSARTWLLTSSNFIAYSHQIRAEFCRIFRLFFGQWNFQKKCFWDLLTFRIYVD